MERNSKLKQETEMIEHLVTNFKSPHIPVI